MSTALVSFFYTWQRTEANDIGRTARIGNEGLATSFYNEDKDADIAPELVKILVESKQRVPDFLESYKPIEETVTFDDDTDNEDEGEDAGATGGSAWGAPTDTGAGDSGNWGATNDAWGGPNDGAGAGANWD